MCYQHFRLFWSYGSWTSFRESYSGNSMLPWCGGSDMSLWFTFHWPNQVTWSHLPSELREIKHSKRRRLEICKFCYVYLHLIDEDNGKEINWFYSMGLSAFQKQMTIKLVTILEISVDVSKCSWYLEKMFFLGVMQVR